MNKTLKVFAILFGSIFCLMHYVFTVAEAGDWWWAAAIILIPLLIWPFIAWRWENVGAWIAFIFGIILIGITIADIVVNNSSASLRGIIGFIVIVLLPFVLSGGLLLYSTKKKKEAIK